ncbi:hypothetical protein VPH35_066222 [Triticum aestivum]
MPDAHGIVPAELYCCFNSDAAVLRTLLFLIRTLPSDGRWGRPIERRCCRTKSPGSFLACRNCLLATGYYHGARRTLACQFVTGHDMHLDDDVASHLSSLTKRTNHIGPRQNIWFFRPMTTKY